MLKPYEGQHVFDYDWKIRHEPPDRFSVYDQHALECIWGKNNRKPSPAGPVRDPAVPDVRQAIRLHLKTIGVQSQEIEEHLQKLEAVSEFDSKVPERIVAYRLHPVTHQQQFRVRWRGHDAAHDSWVPASGFPPGAEHLKTEWFDNWYIYPGDGR